MKTTKFEQTIVLGIVESIKFLERTLETGMVDPDVSAEIFAPAAELKTEIHDAMEKYSQKMLKLHGIED